MSRSYRKPGQSSKVMKALIMKEGRRSVMVRDNGGAYEMSIRQAVVRAQAATALKGSPYAQKYFLQQLEQCEREEAEEIAEENKAYRNYQTERRSEIEKACNEGKPLPCLVPHPDDIIIQEGIRVRIDGPKSEFEAGLIEQSCRVRDVLLMQDALEHRLASESPARKSSAGSAMVIVVLLNNNLPSRFRLDDIEFAMAYARLEATPKRVLLKEVRQAWGSLGVRAARGATLPPMQKLIRIYERLIDCVKQIRAGDIDLDTLVRRPILDDKL